MARRCATDTPRTFAARAARGEQRVHGRAVGPDGAALGRDRDAALAELLGRDPVPLDDEEAAEKPKAVAYIVEEECIGCTLCAQACPVDAISGVIKEMHSIDHEACISCGACVDVCPTDSIRTFPKHEIEKAEVV